MPFTNWSLRLQTVGANAAEMLAVAAAYSNMPLASQTALDTLISGLANDDLRVMLNTWRAGAGPFVDGYPGGGLPFGTRTPLLSGDPDDDVYAIGAGTGVQVSVTGGGGGTGNVTGGTP